MLATPSQHHREILLPVVPEVWVARMLRAGGAVIVVSTSLSVVNDLLAQNLSLPYTVGCDSIALSIGVVSFAFASWLSSRRRRPLLLVAYSLMVLTYAISAIASEDLASLVYPTILLAVGTGALTPWESRWQLTFNGFSLLVWGVVSRVLSHGDPHIADFWLTVLTALGLGQCSIFIRQQFSTDLLDAKRKLEKVQARLRKILSVSPDTVSIIRESDLLVCEVLGNRPLAVGARKSMVGKRLTDSELYTDRRMMPNFLRTISEDQEFHDVEMEYQTDEGRLLQSLISAARVQMDGESYLVSFARDITELKRAQNQLAESERRFRTVFSAMPGAAGIMSPEGRFLDLSKPLGGSGFTREECIGKTADEIGFWAEPEERAEFNRRLKRDGLVDGMEVHMGRKEGGSIPVLVSLAPLEIDGEPCAVSIVPNITELKNAQQRAAESQAALGRIFEASTDGMILSDFSSGEVIDINREFTRLTGYSREDTIGRDVRSLNFWGDRTKASEFAELLRSTNEARNVEDSFRHKTGKLVPCLLSGTIVEFAGRMLPDSEPRHHHAQTNSGATGRRARNSGRGVPGEVRIPLKHVARDTDADECDSRNGGIARRNRA